MSNTPLVKVPVGRPLEPTLTYFDLDEKVRGSHKRKIVEDVGSDKQDGSEVGVIMVTPVEEGGGFEARFLISERKLRSLILDALHWYLGDDVPEEAIQLRALLGKEVGHSPRPVLQGMKLPQDIVTMEVPDDLLNASKLVKITEPPRKPAVKENEEPIMGWVIVALSAIVIIVSLC
ncbi:hypothetical protein C8T65DRAFT_697055 [Cerioporus squamosus]|nr:hypothetical protein C8T65DRAFT_697055 [Cerioporus squamosus]